jgi:small subunit ribosomal protein S16
MLAIRLQRVGRTGYATYRVIVQEASTHPSSGRIVAYVGSYNPHNKTCELDKAAIEKHLSHGAQPSDRVIKLLVEAKIKLPKWVKMPKLEDKKAIRNPEKLRRNQPKEAVVEEAPKPEETEHTENTEESVTEEKPVEKVETTEVATEAATEPATATEGEAK